MSPRTKRLLLNFLLEMVIYATLLVVYFWAVLRFLGEPLHRLLELNLWVYAVASLLLIVVQSVFLEWVTSFLLSKLGIETLE